MKKILAAVISMLVTVVNLHAVTADPNPITVTQPDGTTIVIRMHGDEFLHWTTCGNSLVAQGADGYWHFASFEPDGTSRAHGARVSATPAGDGSGVEPPASAVEKAMEMRMKYMSGPGTSSFIKSTSSSNSPAISTGEKHFLILLIQFSDKSFVTPKESFVDMLSGDDYTYNGAVGSVRKYYNDVSFGKFTPVYDVYGPITVPYTSATCAKNDVYAVIYACQYAHDSLGVNFANYCNTYSSLVDNVFFFFPGYNQAEGGGNNTIWPHAVTYYSPFLTLDGKGIYKYGCTSEFKGASGETRAGIGTFCHEFGHVIGLPDFYDTDYAAHGQGKGLVTLSLMSSGNYNNEGRTPPYFTYEEKHILGWDDGLTGLTDGANTLSKTSENKSYYCPSGTDGEYYLFESRPEEGWDSYTGAWGLAIYHVDKSDFVMPNGYTAANLWTKGLYINDYASHQCMDLIESVYPESKVYYTNDYVFPGRGNYSFTSSSSPAASAWSGQPTGYNITGITFDSGTGKTSFTVEREYKIYGTVTGTSNDPVSGAKVVLTEIASSCSSIAGNAVSGSNCISTLCITKLAGASEKVVTTDAEGKYEFNMIDPGQYSLSVTKEGFLPYSCNVDLNAVTKVNVILPRPVEKATSVLQKYKEISNYCTGFGSGINCYAGLRYTSSELTDYVGFSINSISFMAANGGDGTVDKMGVMVYFGDELQCDCECKTPVFGAMCTVDISEYNLLIPSDKEVTFVYYLLNPSYDCSFVDADYKSPVENANLYASYSYNGKIYWNTANFNQVISVSVISNGTVIDLSGYNYISKTSSYKEGDTFTFKLVQSSVNPPKSVSWTVNGEAVVDSEMTLSEGVYTICAALTYSSGRVEKVETKINVTK